MVTNDQVDDVFVYKTTDQHDKDDALEYNERLDDDSINHDDNYLKRYVANCEGNDHFSCH